MKVIAAVFLLLLTSCAPPPEPILDHATVVAKNASVRMRNSSTSRTLRTLDSGDKVEVLERQENWYRIRYNDELQGWMAESTVVTNQMLNRIHEMAVASQNQAPQNTAVLRDGGNLRIEPGRSTTVIRKMDRGARVEVLERSTNPRPGSESSFDVWFKVRTAPTEVGWLYSGLLEFDIPMDIAEYSEDRIYAAVKRINRVQDSLAGPIDWYVIGEKRAGADPHIDFDGIRVFTWNLKKHRYETAFRKNDLRGVYPLEVGQDQGNPAFRIYEANDDLATKVPRDFVMYGVIVREKKRS